MPSSAEVGTGIDPILSNAIPHNPAKCKTRESSPFSTSVTGSEPTASKPMKRPREESHTSSQQPLKKPRRQTQSTRTLGDSTRTKEDESSSLPPTEAQTQTQTASAFYTGRCLLEMFSVFPLRSHATVCLVNRDRLQLYHANRLVILVSSAINFSTDDGLDKFIAVIIAFHYLSITQNGILDSSTPRNIELVNDTNTQKEDTITREGNVLKFTPDGFRDTITVTLGDVITRYPAVFGRSTVVLKTSEKGRTWL